MRLKIAEFEAGSNGIKRNLAGVNRKLTETAGFAAGMRKKLEDATKALPKIEIDANSTPAEIKVAELRAKLEKLAAKEINVDADATQALIEMAALQQELEAVERGASFEVRTEVGAALSQLRGIQQEVDRINGETARVQVDADTGGAQSQLRGVGTELSRLTGRNARVRVTADVSSALTGIAMVGAALASLPAATSIAVGVGALGAAFTAAGAGAAGFAAVAVPGMTRVNEALAAQESAAKAAGGATGGAGQSAAQAAQQMLQMEAAQKRLKDAQVDARQAQRDLTAAWEEGRRSLQDLNFNLDQAILSQEDAALAVREAAQRLAEVNADPNADQLDRERAELSYRQALQRSEEQEVKTARARKDTAAANKAGIRGTEEYTSAQENLKNAQAEVAEAEQQLKLLRLQQQEAMAGAGGAAGGLADAFAKLSKQERTLAGDVKAFNKAYLDWQRDLQPDVFPVISKGLDLLTVGMNKATPLIRASAGAFGELIDKTKEGLAEEQWSSFFYDLTTQAPRAIEGLGAAAGNVAGGLAGVIQAFLPYTDDLMDFLENATQGFEGWGQNLKGSPEFEAFINYVKENGPKVGEVLSNIATFAGKIVGVGADMSPALLDFLVGLSAKLAAMDPAQIEAIAAGVAAIFAAAKLGATLKIGGLVVLAELIGKMSPGQIQAVAIAIAGLIVAVKGAQAVSAVAGIWERLGGGIDKAGAAADRNKGKLSKLGDMAGAAGGVLAATSALGLLDNSLNGLDTKLGSMSDEMAKFAQTGQLSGKLAEQWGDSLGSVVTDVGSWDEALGRASGTSESFREAISRLANPGPLEGFKTSYLGLMNVVTLGTTEFDKSAEQIGFMDQELANLVSSGRAGEAEQAFARLTKEAQAMGVPVSALKDVFPQYSQAMASAGTASSEAAVGIDAAKQGIDGFKSSLDAFNATTDAAKAIRDLDLAYQAAKKAVDASTVGLEINKAKTDEQRDAAIVARDAFSGYIQKVDDIGRAQQVAGKNTADSTISIAEQLPKLFDLAGSSKEAQARVYDLATNFGISRQMADKARTGSKEFKEELDRLKDKKVKIELDTKKALDQAYAFAKQLLGIKLELPVGIRAPAAPRAYGGIYNADGRQYMASGGIRSAGASPAAMIATSPYMISGRAGPDVVFGEAGMEAYIPLSTGKRDRGLQILQEAAGVMGMAVVPEKIALNAAGSAGGASGGSFSGGGAAMVSVTGIDALRSALDTTALDLTGSLGGATSTLDATLGDAGTLTSSLTGVGEIAGHLADEVTGWGEVIASEVPPLTDAVNLLGDAISAAASGDAKGNTGSKGDERSPRGGSGNSKGATGSKGDERSPRDAAGKAEPPKKIALQGATSITGVAFSGGTNWSHTSRPVQAAPSTSGGSSSSAGGGGGELSLGKSQQVAGSLVHIDTLTVREQADVDVVAAALYSRLGSKGR
ncbi:hypothetical protein [Streptosporangium sp. NPDC002721]|uniref:hypothetical protein n=1 Tax=Streptosporangium sp. NPDC002721 TaxID=3366188 RepID=UPI0036AC42BA